MKNYVVRYFGIISLLTIVSLSMGLFYPLLESSAEESPEPTSLNVVIITSTIIEEPWNTALIQAFDRIKLQKPHGLEIKYDIVESVLIPDAERVLTQLAKTGKYPVIWAHSTYSDIIKNIQGKYPNILWAYSGGGNFPIGENAYWLDIFIYEPAYLLGMLAGNLTKTNVIGAVAGFPYPVVNRPVNAYCSGAKAVNPDIKVKMNYIESWFDPPKAKESALAQIATGADIIYAATFGPFEACKEKGAYAFGHYIDQNDLAPNTIISGTLARWDPCITFIIDEWWNHETKNRAYNAPTDKPIVYKMSEGGSDIAPYHDLSNVIPEKVKKVVADMRGKILSGEFNVPMDESMVKSE